MYQWQLDVAHEEAVEGNTSMRWVVEVGDEGGRIFFGEKAHIREFEKELIKGGYAVLHVGFADIKKLIKKYRYRFLYGNSVYEFNKGGNDYIEAVKWPDDIFDEE